MAFFLKLEYLFFYFSADIFFSAATTTLPFKELDKSIPDILGISYNRHSNSNMPGVKLKGDLFSYTISSNRNLINFSITSAFYFTTQGYFNALGVCTFSDAFAARATSSILYLLKNLNLLDSMQK